MNRLKKFWRERKEFVKGAAIGIASSSVAAAYFVHQTKQGRQLSSFEVMKSSNPNFTDILRVTHRDGEEGFYPILIKVES